MLQTCHIIQYRDGPCVCVCMCVCVRDVVYVQSAEELERLTVDEQLQPIERAVYLLRLVADVRFNVNDKCVQSNLAKGRIAVLSPLTAANALL